MRHSDRKVYVLPGGDCTISAARYVKAWNLLANPVARALNCDVIGLDPHIHLMPRGGSVGFQLPVSVARRIQKMANVFAEALGKPLGKACKALD